MKRLLLASLLFLSGCVQPGTIVETHQHEAERLTIPVRVDGVYCLVYRGTGIDCDFENALGRNGE